MRHATPATIEIIADLLAPVRGRPELRERTPGSFYRKTAGFLHFHEDPAGLFADLKGPDGWERWQADTPEQREALLDRIDLLLSL
jgi:hypothetical protein